MKAALWLTEHGKQRSEATNPQNEDMILNVQIFAE